MNTVTMQFRLLISLYYTECIFKGITHPLNKINFNLHL